MTEKRLPNMFELRPRLSDANVDAFYIQLESMTSSAEYLDTLRGVYVMYLLNPNLTVKDICEHSSLLKSSAERAFKDVLTAIYLVENKEAYVNADQILPTRSPRPYLYK